MVIPKRTTLSLERNVDALNFTLLEMFFFPRKTNWINWIFLGLAFNELFLKQFKAIVMSHSKQFSTTYRLGVDLYKVLSCRKLQMSVFSINIMRSLIKILNMRGPKIEPSSIPVKISIHSLIPDPIFCFPFEK